MELYNKTNQYFKDRARKDCLWERFAGIHKLSVKVCLNPKGVTMETDPV